MSLILNIDTATEKALVSISENGAVIDSVSNENQKDHAAFLQPAIAHLFKKNDLSIHELNAVAVTYGPGSYTGIRVGMASAKGLCFALDVPLITINTLEVISKSLIDDVKDDTALYCAVIDARRMEIFTAVYDHDLKEILQPCSIVADSNLFKDFLKKNKIYFAGSGNAKLKNLLQHSNAVFINKEVSPEAMASLSYKKFEQKAFADLFYSSPLYLKEFYTPSNNNI